MKKKVLFVAENVTLAQVVRLVALARCLDPSRYEVHFACSDFDPLIFSRLDWHRHELRTIGGSAVQKALEAGKRIYEKSTLMRYVKAELQLIDRVKPDLIVGDFRLSLSVSAPVSGVPQATLINAYWSPQRSEREFPVPDHPIVRLLGESLSAQYFPKAIGRVFDHFAAPLNAVRRRYGLPEIGSLLEVLTHGDYTLYADTPGLVPTHNLPGHHAYLGPVLWEPDVVLDPTLVDASDPRPLVYVTLGSSGNLAALPAVLDALAKLPVRAVLATAGRAEFGSIPGNVRVCRFAPGAGLARLASVVVSNGGSTTSYQALSEGTPVVGIASNFDQYLAMQAIERAGAGVLIKARSISEHAVKTAIERVLGTPSYTRQALGVAEEFSRYRAGERFASFVDAVLHGASTRRSG